MASAGTCFSCGHKLFNGLSKESPLACNGKLIVAMLLYLILNRRSNSLKKWTRSFYPIIPMQRSVILMQRMKTTYMVARLDEGIY